MISKKPTHFKFLDQIIISHHPAQGPQKSSVTQLHLSEYEAGRRGGAFPFNVSHKKQLGLPARRRRHHRLLVPLTCLLILSESVRKIQRAAAAAATNLYCGRHAKTIDSSTAECGGALRTLYTFHSGMTSQ